MYILVNIFSVLYIDVICIYIYIINKYYKFETMFTVVWLLNYILQNQLTRIASNLAGPELAVQGGGGPPPLLSAESNFRELFKKSFWGPLLGISGGGPPFRISGIRPCRSTVCMRTVPERLLPVRLTFVCSRLFVKCLRTNKDCHQLNVRALFAPCSNAVREQVVREH